MIESFSLISLIIVITIVIARACDKFEVAADYLGRRLPVGVKGATINAIGSSMPELLTTGALLIIGVQGAFAAGVSGTAGSAVFNSAVIPMFVIMAVMAPHFLRVVGRIATLGYIVTKGRRYRVETEIEVDRKAIARDMTALLIAEIVLIILLGQSVLYWYHGALLMVLYLPYLGFMWWQARNQVADDTGERFEFDFKSKRQRTASAWSSLAGAVAVLAFACFLLGEAIIGGANMLGVHPMISALFLGAAVSSVPDTILSVKDAIKGNYEDALGNALGSNTFDICAALGLPLFLYAAIVGPVDMPDHDAVQVLRVGLLLFTVVIAALLLLPRFIGLWQAKALAAVFVVWVVFALNTEFAWF